MFSAVLIAAAALIVAGPYLRERVTAFTAGAELPKLDARHLAAGCLLVAGIVSWASSSARPDAPTPAPPAPDAKLVLRGKFVGPDASLDATITAALMQEIAAELEYDAGQPDPLLKTGQAMDQLRQRARLLMCRGVSLGDKHPRARDAIKDYLDQAAGVAGGPLSPAQRAAWIAAYREVGRAAEDASR
jgi:hypothetical protein